MVEQRRQRDKYLHNTQHMCNVGYYHRDVAHYATYAKDMESVVLMSDHVGEEYST